MQRLLKGRVAGTLTLATITLCSLALFVPILPFALAKLIVPIAAFQRRCTGVLLWLVDLWVGSVSFMFQHVSGVRIEVDGLDKLDRTGCYLLIANHQTWADIAVLAHSLRHHIAFPRFFIKQELIWLPVIGFVCWALDFPFMKRYRKDFISRHPELKGADLATMRRACEKYRHQPATVANFAEGTRCTAAKRLNTRSPYRHLMRPKSTGTAFMIQAMSDVLSGVIDVTIAYPLSPEPTLWDYACGRIPRVLVRARVLPLPRHLVGGDRSDDDPAVRHGFQSWMNDLWRHKDALLDHLLAPPPANRDREAAQDRADAA